VHHGDDHRLTLELLPDPRRDVPLVHFALTGPYRLVLILAPHLGSTGRDNSAWIDDGVACARGGEFACCLAASF
jgi:glucoamylase